MEKDVIEIIASDSVVACICETIEQIDLIKSAVKVLDVNDEIALYDHEINHYRHIVLIDSDIPSDLIEINILTVVYAHGMQLSINGTTYCSYYGALKGAMELCE